MASEIVVPTAANPFTPAVPSAAITSAKLPLIVESAGTVTVPVVLALSATRSVAEITGSVTDKVRAFQFQ